jgi:uncharacterized membrane protein YecN with MAPEG domain
MPPIHVTALYAGILALLYVLLAAAVIRGRRELAISLGSGSNTRFERTIRGHGNFAEYVPLALLLMALAEINGYPPAIIHTLGAVLLVGRLLHAWCFIFTARNLNARLLGMVLTLATIISGALLALRAGFNL